MRIAVFPGSFDPFTMGHLDILKRAASLFDKVILAVIGNANKNSMFLPDERVSMIAECIKANGLTNVTVDSFGGLTADFVRKSGAGYIVRGLRNEEDYRFESGLEIYNRLLASEIETVYFNCDPALAHISSSAIKELLQYGADIGAFVPVEIYKYIVKGK